MRKAASISEIIMNEAKSNKNIMEEILRLHWKEIVGEALAKRSWLLYSKGGTLYIGVKNSVWLQQMQFFKRELIDNINNYMNNKVVRDIVLKSSDTRRSRTMTVNNNSKEAEINRINTVNITLTPAEKEIIEKSASGITDEKLKEKFINVMVENKKREICLMKDGYKKCRICGELFEGEGSECSFCIEESKTDLRKRVAAIILKKPGITYFEIKEIIREADKKSYNEAKRKILASIKERMRIYIADKKIKELREEAVKYFKIELDSENMEIINIKVDNFLNSFT